MWYQAERGHQNPIALSVARGAESKCPINPSRPFALSVARKGGVEVPRGSCSLRKAGSELVARTRAHSSGVRGNCHSGRCRGAVPVETDPPRHPVRRRQRHRLGGPPAGAGVVATPRPERDRRQSAGANGPDRRNGRCPQRARRLHAVHDHEHHALAPIRTCSRRCPTIRSGISSRSRVSARFPSCWW